MLPHRFAVQTSVPERFVVFESTLVSPPDHEYRTYTLKPVRRVALPRPISYKYETHPGLTEGILGIRRHLSVPPGSHVYHTQMSYDQRRILCEEGSYRTQYPVLTFSQGYLTSLGVILGQRWEHRDMAYAFDCQRTVETFAQQAQSILQQVDEAYPEPANPAPPATFPAFVVRGFLENLLRQNTNCPIAMEPLTRDSVCMTPCFHAFSKDSVVPWIEEQQSCPVCRHPCTLVQLWNLDP